jgi:tetratricopeptide (TPR) repeat protein
MALRDSDSAEAVYRLKSFTWSLTGLVLGGLLGAYYAIQTGVPLLRPVLLGALFLWAVVYFGTLALAERAGRWGSSIYFSGGSRLPPRRDYSLGDSLVVRARYDEAAAEYEAATSRHPDDPEPCLRLARLLRDQLQGPAAAVPWFRQALARAQGAHRLGIQRELIELYVHRLSEPGKALPELARIADEHGGTPSGEWALREMQAIRAAMRKHSV